MSSFSTNKRPPALQPSAFVRASSTASMDSLESSSSHANSPLLTTPCGTLKYNAPEAVKNMVSHGAEQQRTTRGDLPKRDLYSIGIIAFIMLSGQMPFNGKTKSALLDQMSRGASFDSPRWATVSPQAKALVSALLHVDPAQRPTAAEALRLPWMVEAMGRSPAASSVDRAATTTPPPGPAGVFGTPEPVTALGRKEMRTVFDVMYDAEDDTAHARPVLPSPADGGAGVEVPVTED
jgi:serine/threonine protein kinase